MDSLRFFCAVLSILGFIGLTFQASSPDDSFYIAGVVEFEPKSYNSQSSLNQLDYNVRAYLEILYSTEARPVDIIVFPELTLYNIKNYTYVPHPQDKIIPCNNNDYPQFFQDLSCAAKDVKKYVVINLLEHEKCNQKSQANKNDPRQCAENGMNAFNTNVVFNRYGMVVARYRKFHLYDSVLNVTNTPEISTFDTDFGVKFGTFVCFDILFYSPAMDLIKLGIKDIVYTTYWYSELPFLTAVQVQQSWAYANGVNLLAAGGSNPTTGTTGTGIYAGKEGALVSVMSKTPQRKLYVANITKSSYKISSMENHINDDELKPQQWSKLDGILLMREYKLENYTSYLIEPSNGPTIKTVLCHESLCCKFEMKIKSLNPPEGTLSYQYRLGVFSGDRTYSGNGFTNYKVCALFACTNKSLESCGRIFNDSNIVSSELIFEYIAIEGDFPRADKVLIMPNTLQQDLIPLKTNQFKFDILDLKNTYQVRHTLLKPSEFLLTFGIYGNYYDAKSTSSGISFSILFAFISSILTLLAVKICLK